MVSITATNQAGVSAQGVIGVTVGGADASGANAGGTTPHQRGSFRDSTGAKVTQGVIGSGSLDTYSGNSGLNNNVHQWVDGAACTT